MNILRASKILLLLIGFMTINIFAQVNVPTMINYQGFLTDQNGTVLNGPYVIWFRLYEDSTGFESIKWEEKHDAVFVKNGLFNVLLGSIDTLTAGDLAGERYLGIQVGTELEMTPRMRLASVAYSLRAEEANKAQEANYAHTLSAPDNDPMEALVVTNDGNVGVGESNPQAKLEVNGSMKVSGKFDFPTTFGWTSEEKVAWVSNASQEVTVVDETGISGILLMIHATGGARDAQNYVRVYIDGVLTEYKGNVEDQGIFGWLGSDGSSDHNTGVLTLMPFKTFQNSLKVTLYNDDAGTESYI
jgi:hypothetical protein